MTKTTAPNDQDPAIDALPFEEAMAQLETIVGQLERGDVPLESSIEIFERGQKLKQRCDALLRQAEARIEAIQLSATGKPVGVKPLDGDQEPF